MAKLTLAYLGIHRLESFYYLATGLTHMNVGGRERLSAIMGLVVLLSILMHGLIVTPAKRRLDRLHGRDPDDDGRAIRKEENSGTPAEPSDPHEAVSGEGQRRSDRNRLDDADQP